MLERTVEQISHEDGISHSSSRLNDSYDRASTHCLKPLSIFLITSTFEKGSVPAKTCRAAKS